MSKFGNVLLTEDQEAALSEKCAKGLVVAGSAGWGGVLKGGGAEAT